MRLLYYLPLLLSAIARPYDHETRNLGALGGVAFAGAGAGGRRITGLQHLLHNQGHGVAVDGQWGPETSEAVVAVQKSKGLAADGVPGPATLGALVSVVQSGSKGRVVSAAQATLDAGLAVDGDFGPATRNAAIAFQAARGLEQDAIIGRATWTVLFGGGGGGGPSPPPNPPPQPPTVPPKPPTKPPPPQDRGKVDNTGRCPKRIIDLGVETVPNGCGPKGAWDLVPDLDLRACCNAHDRCYGDCGKSKAVCDAAMYACCHATCDKNYAAINPIRYTCHLQADTYVGGVVAFGQQAFDNATKEHCKCVT